MSEAHEKVKQIGEEEEDVEEEEYVLLELDDCLHSDISPGSPFVLSGLDTLTPTLIGDDGLKMIGNTKKLLEHVIYSPKVKLNLNLAPRFHLLEKTRPGQPAAARKPCRRR